MTMHVSARKIDLLPGSAGLSKDQPAVGEALKVIGDGVGYLAERLRPMMADNDEQILAEILADLGQQRCRVAVLGQVKAGKSSLVNGLTHRAGLSPTDINPWTAVVCHLNFGVATKPLEKAIFTFFDEEDWSYLASGRRLRELSERLGVDIDQDLLREQLAQTRARAEQRLGRQFHHLLGQQHCFAHPSADLLSRYVSVGYVDDGGPRRRPMAGRYSDVTKSAELFFDQDPFAFPTTIIDTPGTNDPFLVRDDLTGKAVDGADVHIVVLTAEQALSTADLAMLRMLHGLHKQRMIVFVNRIDALGDPSDETQKVVDHVFGQVAAEFPDMEIPVIAGSALWAELALRGDAIRSADDLPSSLLSYARDPELLRSTADRGDDEARATLAAGILEAAGVTDLETAIDRLLLRGPTMLNLQRALGRLETICLNVDNRLKHDEAMLGQAIELSKQGGEGGEQQVPELDRQLQQMKQAPEELSELGLSFERDIGILKKVTTGRLRTALGDMIATFAEEEGDAFEAADKVSRVSGTWYCDTRPLRRKLEKAFLDAYRFGANELLAIERAACGNMEDIFNQLQVDQKVKMKVGQSSTIDPSPSIGALGKTVALDLTSQWSRWWQRWQTTRMRIKKFRELVFLEFEPIVDALLESAVAELEKQEKASTRHFSSVAHDMSALLVKRQRRLERLRRKLVGEDAGMPVAALVERYEASRQDHAKDARRYREIEAELRQLIDYSRSLTTPGPQRPQ